jgi:hypothetical protein
MTQITKQSTKTFKGASTDADLQSELQKIEKGIYQVLPSLVRRQRTIIKETVKHIEKAKHFGGTIPAEGTLKKIFSDAHSEVIASSNLWNTEYEGASMAAKAAMLARLGKAVQTLETAAKTYELSYYPSQRKSDVAAIRGARETESGLLEIFSEREQEWWNLKDQVMEHTPGVKRAFIDANVESELQCTELAISNVLPGLMNRHKTISDKTIKHIKANSDLGRVFSEAQAQVDTAANLWLDEHYGADIFIKAEMLARLDKAVATMETAAKTLQFSYYANQVSSRDATELSLPIQIANEFKFTRLDEFRKKAEKWWELSASAPSKQGDDVEVLEEDEMVIDYPATQTVGDGNSGTRYVVTICL